MNYTPCNQSESDEKFIMQSTGRIVDLAGIVSKDTTDLIKRSVRQHVLYKKMLSSKNNKIVDIMNYICQLTELENRESALSALSKLRENNPDLAPLLWGTPAVIAALIQEVISVYPYLSGNIEMNSNHSNRCCNALALLQCVASHPQTRGLFLKAYIPLFLYPFLNTELNSRPFEYLRLTSLGVIGALVKHPHPINKHSINNNSSNNTPGTIPDNQVTEFLVKTEAIPLCLHIMEHGNELSQTVATFIIQKILLDDYGLNYVCKTSDRFFAISQVLTKMIQDPIKKPSKKLIKHVVRCYLRLCDDNRAYLALHSVLPKYLQSQQVENLIGDDSNCLNWLKQLRIKYKESLIAQQRSHHHNTHSTHVSHSHHSHSTHSHSHSHSQSHSQQRIIKQQQQQQQHTQQQQQRSHSQRNSQQQHNTQQYQHNQYSYHQQQQHRNNNNNT